MHVCVSCGHAGHSAEWPSETVSQTTVTDSNLGHRVWEKINFHLVVMVSQIQLCNKQRKMVLERERNAGEWKTEQPVVPADQTGIRAAII